MLISKEWAEYNFKFAQREMNFWRNAIAREERRDTPNQQKLDSYFKFYNRHHKVYMMAKTFLENL